MPTKKETKENAEQHLENLLQRVSTLQQIALKLFPELSIPQAVVINPDPPIFYANSIPFGFRFKRKGESLSTYLRARPVSFLLNSTLVSESLATGKVLTVNIETGSCFFIKGDEEVQPLGKE